VAQENINLRDVSLVLPRGRVDLPDGRVGLGKSSLAFDTLYAEGTAPVRREPIELCPPVLGADAQAGGRPDRRAESLDLESSRRPAGGTPGRRSVRSPRSTTTCGCSLPGWGQGHCPKLRPARGGPRAASRSSRGSWRILPGGTSFMVLAPWSAARRGNITDLFADLARAGYVRARVNGQVVNLSDDLAPTGRSSNQIEVVVDRLKVGSNGNPASWRGGRGRRTGAEAGRGDGHRRGRGAADLLLSSHYACAACGIGSTRPARRLFSFNSPQGMCLAATVWESATISTRAIGLRPRRCRSEGAIAPLGPVKEIGKWRRHLFEGVAANLERRPPMDRPRGRCSKAPGATSTSDGAAPGSLAPAIALIVHRWKNRAKVWSHAEKWVAWANELLAKYRGASGGPTRAQLEPSAEYDRPDAKALASTPGHGGQSRRQDPGRLARCHRQVARFFDELSPPRCRRRIPARRAARPRSVVPLDRVLPHDRRGAAQGDSRPATFMIDVGLHYWRSTARRRRSPAARRSASDWPDKVGAGLVGVLYILDEPSIGLHPPPRRQRPDSRDVAPARPVGPNGS